MAKKRIGFFCTKVPSVSPFTNTDGHDTGGAGESLIDLVCNLSNKKYKKYIFTIGTANQIQKESPKPNMELIRYPPSLKIFKKIFSTGENLFSTKFITLPRKKELDIIHCQLGQPLADVAALYYIHKKDVPLVLSIRGVQSFEWGSNIRRILMKIYLETVYSMILEESDLIVVQSKGVLEKSSRLNKYNEKIKIVPNGVDFDTFSTYNQSNEFTSKLSHDLERFDQKLLFVGNLVKGKGIHTLVKSFEKVLDKFPSTCLIVVGKGPQKKYIQNWAKENNCESNVILTGFISSKDELAKIYSSADLFVFPSLAEGFPRVILESMAAGTSCLVSDIGPNYYAIGEGEYGLVAEVSNPDHFAEKIIRFIQMDESEKETLSKKSIEYAKSHSWEEVAKQMEEIYEGLLK